MSKTRVIKSFKEWNTMIDTHKKLDVKYIVLPPVGLTAMIKDEYGTVYATSLSQCKVEYNDGAISSSFRSKCKYPIFKDGEYGRITYSAPGSFGLKEKVRWLKMEIKTGYAYSDEFMAKKPLKCWSYDINSAFPYAMLQKMPDTSVAPLENVELPNGYMGFYEDGTATLTPNVIVRYAFPLMDSPFKEYVLEYYTKKQKAETKEEKAKYKAFLNHPTGYLCKHNIFLRNAIIFYSNEYIISFMDRNTVYCNIDCIVSLTPRYDLPIGDGIGQFKEEHVCEDFKYLGPGMYQWGDECHYRGIPGDCISDIEDIDNWLLNAQKKIDKEGYIYEETEN